MGRLVVEEVELVAASVDDVVEVGVFVGEFDED